MFGCSLRVSVCQKHNCSEDYRQQIHLTPDVKATGQEQQHTAHDHPRRPTWRRLVFPLSVSGCWSCCSRRWLFLPTHDREYPKRSPTTGTPPQTSFVTSSTSAVFPRSFRSLPSWRYIYWNTQLMPMSGTYNHLCP